MDRWDEGKYERKKERKEAREGEKRTSFESDWTGLRHPEKKKCKKEKGREEWIKKKNLSIRLITESGVK